MRLELITFHVYILQYSIHYMMLDNYLYVCNHSNYEHCFHYHYSDNQSTREIR